MTNGVESFLDETTAKALDRLQRYASANQRSYFKALQELRTVQNNRIVRETLERQDNPLPELISVAELSKRTHQYHAAADMAEWRSKKAFIDSPLPRGLQNEATQNPGQSRQEVA